MYYFIVNPNSSSGKGYRIFQTIEPILKKEKVPYHAFFTKSGSQAARLAHRLSSEKAPATIVAVGGDGTANDVLNGLTNFKEITFGYIPTGSGNDLARGLHLECDPVKALYAILNPTLVCPLSLGVVETPDFSHRFAVSSGIGFDASVCHGALRSKIKDFLNRFGLGKLTYTGIALKQIFLLKPAHLSLTLDDGKTEDFSGFFFSAAMNLPYEGGGFMFCPKARGDDDLLNLCLVEKMPKLKVLLLLPTAFFGKHTVFRGIHIRTFQKAHLQADRPLYVHTDGEVPGTARCLTWYLLKEQLPFILK